MTGPRNKLFVFLSMKMMSLKCTHKEENFQYHRSSCQVTYQHVHFIVKDAKISRRYTKLGNKIMFWQWKSKLTFFEPISLKLVSFDTVLCFTETGKVNRFWNQLYLNLFICLFTLFGKFKYRITECTEKTITFNSSEVGKYHLLKYV